MCKYGNEFYNRSRKSWLEKNAIEMYSRHVVAERLITNSVLAIRRTSLLWNSPLSYSVDKLDDIDNKYNNAHHSIVKMKPADVKSSTRMESSKEINNKDLKFRNGDIVRISNFGYIFAKGYVTN